MKTWKSDAWWKVMPVEKVRLITPKKLSREEATTKTVLEGVYMLGLTQVG